MALYRNILKSFGSCLNGTKKFSTSQNLYKDYSHLYKPKAQNPFLYQYDKYGRVKRLKPPGGRKKIPFDRRFPVSLKDITPDKWGGSQEMVEKVKADRTRFPHPPGYTNEKGKFVLVEEMIPEFVVPDLTDFELKPYVSYKAGENITQTEFTAKDLFDATYGKETLDKYADGKLTEYDPTQFQSKA